MDTAEIEVGDEQGNRVPKVLQRLAEAHCEARMATIKQAHGKICALNMAGAD